MKLMIEMFSNKLAPWLDVDVEFEDTTEVIWENYAKTTRISNQSIIDTHYWHPYVASISPMKFNMNKDFGGAIKISFGDISFVNNLFSEENLWPPPINQYADIYVTPDSEANKVLIYQTMLHRKKIDLTTTSYDFFPNEYDIDILEEIVSGYGDGVTAEKVLLQRVIGFMAHIFAVRLEDVSGNPTYHKAYISGSLSNYFVSVSDNGTGEPRFTTNANHGFETDDVVTIEGADRSYDGGYAITKIDETNFDILSLSYSVDTIGYCYDDNSNYRVYDDGVPIPDNVVDDSGSAFTAKDTFHLTSTPVGDITISGIGEDSTLSEVFHWACNSNNLNLIYDATHAKSPSIGLNYLIEKQFSILDFLNDISAYCSHVFYILNDTLYLIDMDSDVSSKTLTEYDLSRKIEIYNNSPVYRIDAEWTINQAVEETSGKYVKKIEKQTQAKSLYPYGDNKNEDIYNTSIDDVFSRITDMLTTINKEIFEITLPIDSTAVPLPGYKYSYVDTNFIEDISYTFHVRNIEYNFDIASKYVKISGDGTMS